MHCALLCAGIFEEGYGILFLELICRSAGPNIKKNQKKTTRRRWRAVEPPITSVVPFFFSKRGGGGLLPTDKKKKKKDTCHRYAEKGILFWNKKEM